MFRLIREKDGANVATLLGCIVVAIFIVFAGSLFNFDEIIDQHFTWVAAFANAASIHWPPFEPFLMDVPLHYHYLYNVHIGMASNVTGVPLILVASRLAIIFHAFSFILMLYAFSASRLSAGWLGIVAAIALLLTFGYSEVMWKQFHFATASIMYRVASTIIAFQIFIVLLDEILAAPQRRLRYWLIIGLILVGSGTRAMMLPMLAGGVGLTMLASIRDPEQLCKRTVMFLTILGGVAFGSVFFLGFGGGVSDGTKLVFINPFNLAVSEWATGLYSPLVIALLDANVSAHIASLLYLIVAVCGRTTFLLPGIFYALLTPSLGRDFRLLLGGIALSGIGLLVLVETVIPQEIWAFYWYADIALALLGVAGLHGIWLARNVRPRLAALSFTAVAILFALQAWEFSQGFTPKLEATNFPTHHPAFRVGNIPGLESSLAQVIKQGDVLVTGGKTALFDERVLPADVLGLQLYASRVILPVYAARTAIDRNVASRLWLMDDDLSLPTSRNRVLNEVGAHRSLYLLWLGSSPLRDKAGLIPVNVWPEASLWLIVGNPPVR